MDEIEYKGLHDLDSEVLVSIKKFFETKAGAELLSVYKAQVQSGVDEIWRNPLHTEAEIKSVLWRKGYTEAMEMSASLRELIVAELDERKKEAEEEEVA